MRCQFVRRILGSALFTIIVISGCKTRNLQTSNQLDSNASSNNNTLDAPQVLHQINKNFKAGESFTIPLDPKRVVDQITVKYDGHYSIVVKDQNGKTMENDEGAPFYKDGMYAFGYSVSETGVKREIAPKKFVDAYETDNWHDLTNAQGSTLLVEFDHGAQYKNDPEVVNAKRTIRVTTVLVRYKDEPGQVYQEFLYNKYDEDSMSSSAIKVESGGSHVVEVDSSRKIYRIDVRWGDEKPRINGVYVSGMASGRLSVNGKIQDSTRNVAAIETQVWYPITYSDGDDKTKIEVSFSGDTARIHWIRAYYKNQ